MRDAWTDKKPGRGTQRAVLREIMLSGPLSRTEIASRSGLTAATISRITRELIDARLVRELPAERDDAETVFRDQPGRRPVSLDIDPRGGQVLGIRISPSFQTIALANLKNQIIADTDLTLDGFDDPDSVIKRVADECQRLITLHIKDRSRLFGGFITIPAMVDQERKSVWTAPYLGWHDVPLGSKLASILDLPMRIESLSTTFILAETYFGVARGRKDVLALLSGLGLGVGLLLNGRLAGNRNHRTTLVGSMPVIGKDGNTSRLDRIASGFHILHRLHGDRFDPSDMSADKSKAEALKMVINRDLAGDPTVVAPISEAAREWGRIAAQLIRLVVPEVVVIAGPLSLSPSYVTATRQAIIEGLDGAPIEVVSGEVTGSDGGQWATCGMAICEYMFENDSYPRLMT